MKSSGPSLQALNTDHTELLRLTSTTDYCLSWPSPVVANTDKDSTKSSAYNIWTELFIIPNVQALSIPYSFTVYTRYSLFPFRPRN